MKLSNVILPLASGLLLAAVSCKNPDRAIKVTPLPSDRPAARSQPPAPASSLAEGNQSAGLPPAETSQPSQSSPSAQSSTPPEFSLPLTEEKVRRIARKAVQDQNIDLNKYQEPRVVYDSQRTEWTVWYFLKPPVPPGGYFSVDIDQESGRVNLTPP